MADLASGSRRRLKDAQPSPCPAITGLPFDPPGAFAGVRSRGFRRKLLLIRPNRFGTAVPDFENTRFGNGIGRRLVVGVRIRRFGIGINLGSDRSAAGRPRKAT